MIYFSCFLLRRIYGTHVKMKMILIRQAYDKYDLDKRFSQKYYKIVGNDCE